MKMNVELIKQFADIRQSLKEEGVYGIIDNQLQVSNSVLKEFEQLQVKTRNDGSNYPYEVFAEVEGIRIITLVTSENIKEFPQLDKQYKEQLKADLLKQLSYLEEDVDLSGMEEGAEIA
jgi:peptide subunit release factor RF-3